MDWGADDADVGVGRLLDRDISPGFTAQNIVDILCGAPEQMRPASSSDIKAAASTYFTGAIDRRQSRASRQGIGSDPIGEHDGIGRHIKCVRAGLERLDGRRDILDALDFEQDDIEAKRSSRCRNLAHLDDGTRSADIRHDRQTTETGTTSRKSSRRLPAVSVCWSDSPVTLPPGRAKLDDTGADRVRLRGKDDRDDLRGLLGREDRCGGPGR